MKLLWLRRLFLLLIAVASLYAAARNLSSTFELGAVNVDPVAQWEERFEPLSARLPFVRGVVGYVSDADVPGSEFDSANDAGEYVLTQYAVAPIIIVRGSDQEWLIANLNQASFGRWQSEHGADWELVSQGAGLYLLRRLGS